MFLRWLQSMKGKRVFGGLVVLTSTSAGYANIAMHTYFLHKYRSFMQMYRSGFEVPIPDEFKELADKVYIDCDLLQREVDALKLFTVVGLDSFSAGSLKLRCGAIIGVPYSHRYNCKEDVEMSMLNLPTDNDQDRKFDFSSPLAQRLMDSLVLSNAAKRFALAREVYSCTTYCNTIRSIGTTISLFFGYTLGTFLNHRYQFEKRLPLAYRAIAYTVCGTISVVTCMIFNDSVNLFYDSIADEAAAKLGRDYAEGGVEYYEKQVELNKALHEALGNEGKKYYTAGGNFNSWLKMGGLPPMERLQKLRHHLEGFGSITGKDIST